MEKERNMLEITIPGEPIAKARPRFTNKNGKKRAYNPQETEEGKFMTHVLFQIDKHELFTGPLHMNMFFYKTRPLNHYGTGRNAGKLKPSAPEWPITKPDFDNYEKFACDCLNELVFKDDAQIVSTRTIKAFAEDPKTIIQIEPI